MELINLFNGQYRGKRVLITGHTGFKGSWLTLWLKEMGAIVKGYSLPPNTNPSHWDILNLDIDSVYGDLLDREKLREETVSFKPEIVFHLAAQPLVRRSYLDPYETFNTNVMGTLSLLEACRDSRDIKAIIIISSDKCYENKEWVWGYREDDAMGGYDPYSASKGCVELLISSFRRSFFHPAQYGITHQTLIASARAGNVIGGGDWAEDRLIPDLIRALENDKPMIIRNPDSTRPWQHVLDPLSGYLILGEKLLEGKKEFATAWNFGPSSNQQITVMQLVQQFSDMLGNLNVVLDNSSNPHESTLLKLDCSKSNILLKWRMVWENVALLKTSEWYLDFVKLGKVVSQNQLVEYVDTASKIKSIWVDGE